MSKISLRSPVLFVMMGYPGAGKSYVARQLADELGIAHVSADRLRHELYDEPQFDQTENKLIFNLMDYMTEQFLEAGVSVIYDGNVNRRTHRRRVRQIAQRFHAAPLTIWVQTDMQTALTRAGARDRRRADDKYTYELSPEVFGQLKGELQTPQYEEYVVVSGKHDFRTQLGTISRKLKVLDLIAAPEHETAASRPLLGGPLDV